MRFAAGVDVGSTQTKAVVMLSNTEISHYRILSKLGAGGMGEVYRARDTRLGRDVAVKILPPAFSTDSDRLHRFEQEACAAGAINHPNILSIYDVGVHDGSPYLVSELLEGETLRQRLRGLGAHASSALLSQRKAVDYALQIAHGLAAAHEKGIVHRDLKPDNIFITKDGRVKILDFGIAKLTQADGDQSQTDIPTRRVDTDPGVVMGTVGYMSPEQVRGKPVDHRSDIFSFGAILYEMLSGRRAFHGESAADTMSAILKEDPPDLSETNQNISPALERLVNHCLEKNPEARFHSASDLAFALEALSGSSGTTAQTVAMPALAPRWMRHHAWFGWIAAVIFLLAFLAALPFIHFRQAPTEAHATRLSVLPPEKTTLSTVTVSPDGRRLAFIATDAAGKTLLWVRPLDSLAAQPLAGTDDASYPFWSPDSRFIGFFADGKLKKVEVTGGPPSTLCIAPSGRGGAWNRDDVIVLAPYVTSGLSRVSASGGEPTPLTTLDSSRQEDSHRFPQFLPDGRHFLYFARGAQPVNSAVYVGSLDRPQAKRIIGADTIAAYAPPGYLLFPREGTLMAQAFDAASLELTGAPFRVAEQVGYSREITIANFSVSDTGVLVYRSSGAPKTELVWVDRSGKQLGSPGPPGDYGFPALSPDEKRLAITRKDVQTGTTDIWLLDLVHAIPSRFTFDPAGEMSPIWSPDGSRIVFASFRDGFLNLYQKLSSGAGGEEVILKSSDHKIPKDWSLDGRFILYTQVSPGQWGLWVLPLFGDRQPIPFLQTKFGGSGGVFSPDARWIAYQLNDSGSSQVYVQSFPPSGGKWQISSEGGSEPRFRRDGQELFYLAANGKLMVVEVKANASSFEFSVPKPLFETHTTDRYAVTADGQRFLMNTPVEESASSPITVVLNWAAELKR